MTSRAAGLHVYLLIIHIPECSAGETGHSLKGFYHLIGLLFLLFFLNILPAIGKRSLLKFKSQLPIKEEHFILFLHFIHFDDVYQ